MRDKDICSLAFSDAESIYRVMSCRSHLYTNIEIQMSWGKDFP